MVDVTLHLGDCLEVMKDIPAGSVDAVVTDLPYGVTGCKWDEVIPFAPMWEQVGHVCKGVFLTTASQPFTSALVMSNPKWFKCEWIWNKETGGSPMVYKTGPFRTHESILVFCQSTLYTYNPIEVPALSKNIRTVRRKKYTTSFSSSKKEYIVRRDYRFPKSIITVNGMSNETHRTKRVHTTQKPVALYEYLIKTYTDECDTVLDITMGSGTTGVACVQTGRNFIGIEIEPKYYEIAEKRIKEAQLQMRMPI